MGEGVKHQPTIGYLVFTAGRAYHVATRWEPEPHFTNYRTLCGITEKSWRGRGSFPEFSDKQPAGQRACRTCQYRQDSMDSQ